MEKKTRKKKIDKKQKLSLAKIFELSKSVKLTSSRDGHVGHKGSIH